MRFALKRVMQKINFEGSEIIVYRVISRKLHVRDLEFPLIRFLRQPHWFYDIRSSRFDLVILLDFSIRTFNGRT